MTAFLTFLLEQHQYIFELLLGHIQLTLLSVSIAVCLGIPLGVYISGRDKIMKPVMGFANLAQACRALHCLVFSFLIWVSALLPPYPWLCFIPFCLF